MRGQWLTRLDRGLGAMRGFGKRRPLLRGLPVVALITPSCRDVFTVMAIGHFVLRQVRPQVTRARLVYVGNAQLERKIVSHLAFVVVGSLPSAVSDLPGLLGVVAGDRRVRPDVPVAGDFAGI